MPPSGLAAYAMIASTSQSFVGGRELKPETPETRGGSITVGVVDTVTICWWKENEVRKGAYTLACD